jgi:hypothetical protein
MVLLVRYTLPTDAPGALQVTSEPFFQPKVDLKPLFRREKNDDQNEYKTKFEDALQAWEDGSLRKHFIRACNDLPDNACCCGLIRSTDSSSTIQQYTALLNNGWIKHANKTLVKRGFKIDAYHWRWPNTAGKSETNILLIRFFELSTYKFRRASQEGSIDFDDILQHDCSDDDDEASSQYNVSQNGKEDDNNYDDKE